MLNVSAVRYSIVGLVWNLSEIKIQSNGKSEY